MIRKPWVRRVSDERATAPCPSQEPHREFASPSSPADGGSPDGWRLMGVDIAAAQADRGARGGEVTELLAEGHVSERFVRGMDCTQLLCAEDDEDDMLSDDDIMMDTTAAVVPKKKVVYDTNVSPAVRPAGPAADAMGSHMGCVRCC